MKGKQTNIFKSLLALTLAVVMVLGLMLLSGLLQRASAGGGGYEEEGKSGIWSYYYSTVSNSAYIFDCDSQVSGVVSIPDKVDKYSVAGFSGNPFKHCEKITGFSVSSANSKFAVQDGVLFEKVTLDESSSDTSNFILLSYPLGKKEKSYTVPNKTIEILSDAFSNNKNLESVEISDSVISIESYAFQDSSITSINVGTGVSEIALQAFGKCAALKSINVKSGNSKYYSESGVLFSKDSDCVSLVQYPEGLKNSEYTVPNDVEQIELYAFYNCNYLTSITLGEKIDYLGDDELFATVYSSNVTNSMHPLGYEQNALGYINNLSKISVNESNDTFYSIDGVLFNKSDKELVRYPKKKNNEEYNIPQGTEAIGLGAFTDCEYLKKVSVPESVIYMPKRVKIGGVGADARFYRDNTGIYKVGITVSPFVRCGNLTDIYVEPENEYFSSEDGVLFDKEKTILFCYPAGNIRKDYTIPESVKEVAFSYINEKTQSNIKNAYQAFIEQCYSGGSASVSNVFDNCKNLERITVSNGVVDLRTAFIGCDNLTDVYYGGTASQWKEITMLDYSKGALSLATIHYNYTDEHVCTEKKLIKIDPQCEVNGISYYICCDCGKVMGEKTVIPATGHDWSEWVVTKTATTTSEGSCERICSSCAKKEVKTISILAQTVKDEETGIEIAVPSNSYDGKITLEVDEIFDGESFQIIEAIDGNEQSRVYDVTTKIDGKPTQPNVPVTVRIPLPEGYDASCTYVYHVNSETGEVENMNARYDGGCLVFETNHFSVYAVVEMKASQNDSVFKKILNVLLTPFKLIINLFKAIFSLFKK